MKLKHLCLLLLAVVACAAAQSEDDIPVENDNQFPPDNISESEGDVLNEPEDILDDTTTQPSDQPADDSTLSTIETDTPTTETANTDVTTETSTPPVEETQSTTQEEFVTSENEIASNTTEASVDAVDDAVTEISTSAEPLNEDVTTETSTPLIEDVPLAELEETEAIEEATLAEPVETVSTEPTVTQTEEVPTTEPNFATSEIDTNGEPDDADATDLTVAVDQDQDDNQDEGEPIDAATTESSSLDEDVSFSTIANEIDVGASNDSATDVATLSLLSAEDVQLPTTEVSTSTESVLDVTTEPSVPLTVDEQLPTDDSDVTVSTDIASPIEPLDVSTTEAVSLAVNEELPTTELEENINTEVDESETTLEGSDIAKDNLQTTQTNEESLNDGETVTPVTPIDPSEFSIRSNKARYDLEAVSPLTLAEAPKEVVAPQELDLPKDTKADNKVEDVDNKVEDVSVGATTSVNKAGGIDKSVIAVIVAGMVVVVAGITIKKNWKSIKNKFSSSPRPANDRANHTNGITPEEVPLQDKDNKNPSPV